MTAAKTKQTDQKETGRISRPPVVAVMGHIDHGKTTLLDYIRKTSVAAKEAGGITQHVAAYEVSHSSADGKERSITFIDTPGHEAFAGIRNRGAQVADIAILVVSGEDGVKPQTVQALKFIQEHKVPYIVAITKIDKASADIDRTKQSLAEHSIFVEGYGGSVPVVPVSAVTGAGIDELLDMILLSADIEGITADATKMASGVVLEVTRSKESGISATLIVKDGTLSKGAVVVCGSCLSVLRIMENFAGKRIETAGPGMPAVITGWNDLPAVGATFISFKNKKEAEGHIKKNAQRLSAAAAESRDPNESRVAVPIIIKADTRGSLEALQYEIGKLVTDKIFLSIIKIGEGDISESDIKTAASGTKAFVFGLNVNIDNVAKTLADRDRVTIETFDIIYKLIERLQEILSERTPKVETLELHGRAHIKRFFSSTKDRQIIGGKVTDGEIRVGDEFKLVRRGAEVGAGRIRDLEQHKVKTREVTKDLEFGALVEAKIEVAPGDDLEIFTLVQK